MIESTGHAGHAVGVEECVLDRKLHVGRAELGNQRPVDEFDERMDDRLRMDEHGEPLRRQAEQPPRLDELQSLVHHRRRVDRNLRAHRPGRMPQRLLRRRRRKLLCRPRAKRSATGREHDPLHLGGGARPQGLVDRRVLAVDRQDLGAGPGSQSHHEWPSHHERLFVGERHRLARLDGRPGAPQTSRTRNGRHHTVDLGRLHEVVERLGSHGQPGARRQIGGVDRGGRSLIDHHHVPRTAGTGLLDQPPDVAVGREQKRGEPAPRRSHDFEGARPHAPGRSEDGNVQAAAGRQGGHWWG